MTNDRVLLKKLNDIETDYIKFYNIEIIDGFDKRLNCYDKFICYNYSYKIDEVCKVRFGHVSKLDDILCGNLYYIEDYMALALYSNDVNLLEEKSKERYECYLTTQSHNN